LIYTINKTSTLFSLGASIAAPTRYSDRSHRVRIRYVKMSTRITCMYCDTTRFLLSKSGVAQNTKTAARKVLIYYPAEGRRLS